MTPFGPEYDKTAAKLAEQLKDYCIACGCMYCVFRVEDEHNALGACAIRRPRDDWRLEKINETEDEKTC